MTWLIIELKIVVNYFCIKQKEVEFESEKC